MKGSLAPKDLQSYGNKSMESGGSSVFPGVGGGGAGARGRAPLSSPETWGGFCRQCWVEAWRMSRCQPGRQGRREQGDCRVFFFFSPFFLLYAYLIVWIFRKSSSFTIKILFWKKWTNGALTCCSRCWPGPCPKQAWATCPHCRPLPFMTCWVSGRHLTQTQSNHRLAGSPQAGLAQEALVDGSGGCTTL